MAMTTILSYGAALLLSLVLAAWLTPRAWWRRANARAIAVLAGGTLVIGMLFDAAFRDPAPLGMAPSIAAQAGASGQLPVAGQRYRAWDNLNLRADVGIGARRLATLPAGAAVTASGAYLGDWWQVSAVIDGRTRQGWASSLWLRRADEAGSRFAESPLDVKPPRDPRDASG